MPESALQQSTAKRKQREGREVAAFKLVNCKQGDDEVIRVRDSDDMSSSMRCFKSFFKYTWQPQQMDSSSRYERTKKSEETQSETELGEVKVVVGTTAGDVATPTTPETRTGKVPCRNGGCKNWRTRTEPRMESPWHLLKTVFLVSVIVALILWAIVYALLAQYQIL